MENHRWIEISRRIYARLLYLYPTEHRAEYGADMLQLFTDQCRPAGRPLALLALWLRTLVDLGLSALREHMASPQATLGLLESAPNAPLPWKGVALVLIPGLAFFIGQVGQLMGQDWFYWMIYRAAYFLIIPVLLVWAWKRKFPIWGLVPLGLLCKTLSGFVYRWFFLALDETNPLLGFMYYLTKSQQKSTPKEALVIFLLVVILGLLWLVWRRVGISRLAWAWLGVYVLLVISNFLVNGQDYIFRYPPLPESPEFVREYLFFMGGYGIITYGGFLGLILFGALLSRRHGRLAVLLPLGYLLPTVLYGRMSNEWPIPGSLEFAYMFSVSVGILVYRFIVALAGPLWVVRSATLRMQKRAGIITLVSLLAIQGMFNLGLFAFTSGGWQPQRFISSYMMIVESLILGAGILMALVLYQAQPAAQAAKAVEEALPTAS
jgi:hypothetical protein